MTDKQVFEKMICWLNLELVGSKKLQNGNIAVLYHTPEDALIDDPPVGLTFSSVGYEGFEAGAIFTPEGKLVKGFLDSHVAARSENREEIVKIIRDYQLEEIIEHYKKENE